MKNFFAQEILPFFTFPHSPRRTLNRVLSIDLQFGVVILSMIQGITAALRSSAIHGLHPLPDLMGLHPILDEIIHFGLGESPGTAMTVITILIYGCTLGLGLNLLGGFLLRSVGLMLGGNLKNRGHRAAIAWSFTPYIFMLPVWLGYIILNSSLLRSTGFNYGILLPWDLGTMAGTLLTLDYTIRLCGLFYLAWSYTVVQKISLARAGMTVALATIPFGLYFAANQAFGF